MERVEGKTAFITGGANGIGLGMAKAFNKAGMKVVIADIRQDHIDQAMAHFGGDENVHAIRLDVTDREAMSRAADEAEKVFGKVHIFCSNAGVMPLEADEPTYEECDWILGVNLGGAVNGFVTFVPRIKKHGEGGHIVNTTSLVVFVDPTQGFRMYITAKAAVRGLSEELRWSLASHNIGVSLLVPGIVNTGLWNSYSARPAHLLSSQLRGLPPDASNAGVDPGEVGEKVLKAILQNEFYIFTSPGFRDEVKEICAEIVEAMPAGEIDPRLAPFEQLRRQPRAALKAQRTPVGQ
jgi:NAD(P)-dependent dehydrogenase (short-subunit alcohol dehydrogenase family)